MTDRGCIAVDRGIFGHPRFAAEPCTEREAWIWLISEAALKAHKRRIGPLIINLRRGQLAHSIRFLASAWQWSVGKVRRFLNRLSTDLGPDDEPLIDVAHDQGITVVTIRKYNSYQRWLRLSETPHTGLSGTPTDTPTNTPIDTGQLALNLSPTSTISDDPKKTIHQQTQQTAQQQTPERLRLSSSSSSSSEGQPSPKVVSVTDQDREFAARFLKAIQYDDTALEAAEHYALVWRSRGYDMEWAIALGAEIAHDKKNSHPPLSYFNKAIQQRQDTRARDLAANACPTTTPPPPRPTESNGHAALPSHSPGKGHSTDWQRRRDHASRVKAEFRQHVRQSSGTDS